MEPIKYLSMGRLIAIDLKVLTWYLRKKSEIHVNGDLI